MTDFSIDDAVATPQTLSPGDTGRVGRGGVLTASFGPAINLFGDVSLTVQGVVEVLDGQAIAAEGAGARITVRDTGFVHSPFNYAGYFNGATDFDFDNAGTVSSDGLSALFFSAGGDGRVENSGLILGVTGIEGFLEGPRTLEVVNDGRIEGFFSGVVISGGGLELTNRGAIVARGEGPDAFAIRAAPNDSENTPPVRNVVINDGRIVGVTKFESGENRFDGRGGAQDAVIGGTGTDILRGGGAADSLFGGTGEDRLFGGGGRDLLDAGAEDDLLYGGAGADRLNGGAGADRLFGEGGDDLLEAGRGGDRLDGGAGRDRLVAGREEDLLIGGANADIFVFDHPSAAGMGAARDAIADFRPGSDLIDVSGMVGSKPLRFIGDAAFSGAARELRYDPAKGVVAGDMNGDGKMDFAIDIDAAPPLGADDFIL